MKRKDHPKVGVVLPERFAYLDVCFQCFSLSFFFFYFFCLFCFNRNARLKALLHYVKQKYCMDASSHEIGFVNLA